MNLEQSLSTPNEAETSVVVPAAYEAPTIESVLTPDSLEREVQYAGATPVSQLKPGV